MSGMPACAAEPPGSQAGTAVAGSACGTQSGRGGAWEWEGVRLSNGTGPLAVSQGWAELPYST